MAERTDAELKYLEKFYEVWRDGKNLGQVARPGVGMPLVIGDVLVEYQLNRVLKIQDFTKSDEDFDDYGGRGACNCWKSKVNNAT